MLWQRHRLENPCSSRMTSGYRLKKEVHSPATRGTLPQALCHLHQTCLILELM